MSVDQSLVRKVASAAAVLFLGTVPPYALAQSVPSGLLPAGANTTSPGAPFYIDPTGLNFSTSPPTRDPSNPNYPKATSIADGHLPPVPVNGNFIIGPSHPVATEVTGTQTGTVYSFRMWSYNSKIYPAGLVRVEPSFDYINQYGRTVPGDFSTMLVPNCFTAGANYCGEAAIWTRVVQVYVPRQARGQDPLPFIVSGDGVPSSIPSGLPTQAIEPILFPALDNLIRERRIPPMVAITVENGGQDAQGSQRGFEYDSMNGQYAEFIETEVLPMAEKAAGIRLTRDPAGRIAMGYSASGEAAFTMAWFHPELFGKVLSYSPTFTNQQWPHNPNLPGGAWQYHSQYAGPPPTQLLQTEGFNLPAPAAANQSTGLPLVPNSPRKPIRVWYEVGDFDGWYPNPMADGMHDYVLACENMARALAGKGYEYQFIFSRNAGHVDFATIKQTLPNAIEYLMQGYHRDDN
ncbi:MAG: alpha/beta hydrolase-fold protein [Paraburkholderia sp.]|uniref:alpha/beta hydrolase n=2 Tax=Burkholderiales TaxID=80840 RepID=UPI001BB256FF|nr:alpha/beta hydrolase-fold protein [Burkholderia sp. 4M9327F10]